MGSVTANLPHPFDPLTLAEIETAITTVKKAHGDVFFNVVSLQEPRKTEMTAWLADSGTAPRPKRMAEVVVIAHGGKVYDGLVDLAKATIIKWDLLDGEQPIVRFTNTRHLLKINHLPENPLDYHGRAPVGRAYRPKGPQGH